MIRATGRRQGVVALVDRAVDEGTMSKLRAACPDLELLVCLDQQEYTHAIGRAEVALAFKVSREAFRRAERLRWLQCSSAGIEHILFPEVVASDLVVTNARGIHVAPVSEHVFALLLGLTRQIARAVRAQCSRRWDKPAMGSMMEVAGKTMGILGLGNIGLEVAARARAFGMHTIGIARTPVFTSLIDRVHPPGDLMTLLPDLDVLVIALPLTQDTRGLIGERALRAMKPSSYLINVARGGIVDEVALVRALREEWIAGAGLDVFDEEPLPESSPLYDLDNVILTPHMAGSTSVYNQRVLTIFAENFRRYVEGAELMNVVDKTRGY